MQNETITTVNAKQRLLSLNLKELWRYRDLIILFVKRDFKNTYKQTILGPIWILIKPFLSTFVFTVIFGMIANISTDGIPQFLFFMSGNILWTFFSSCLSGTSSTFVANARLFGKVYFPRLVMPAAAVIYNAVSFLIQFVMFVVLILIYMFSGSAVSPNILVLLTPLLLLMTALLSVGCGLIVSSLTAKYRDLGVLVSFGITLWMYLTPVVWPVSQVPQSLRWLAMLNPMAPIIESFRCAFLGSGAFEPLYMFISLLVTLCVLLFGIIIFNHTEKNFIDTV